MCSVSMRRDASRQWCLSDGASRCCPLTTRELVGLSVEVLCWTPNPLWNLAQHSCRARLPTPLNQSMAKPSFRAPALTALKQSPQLLHGSPALITWLFGVHVLIMNELRTFLLLTEKYAGVVTTTLHRLYICFFISYPINTHWAPGMLQTQCWTGTHRQHQDVVPALHAPLTGPMVKMGSLTNPQITFSFFRLCFTSGSWLFCWLIHRKCTMTNPMANELNPVVAMIGCLFPDFGSVTGQWLQIPEEGAQDYFITTSF